MTSLQHRLSRRHEQGFTLIELLVVMLIIGVLAAIAVPMFLNQRKAAVDASIKSDVKNLAMAAQTWKVSNPSSRYPSAAWRTADAGNPNGTHNAAELPFEPSEGNSLRIYHGFDEEGFCIEAWSAGSTEWKTEDTPYTFFQEDGTPGRTRDC